MASLLRLARHFRPTLPTLSAAGLISTACPVMIAATNAPPPARPKHYWSCVGSLMAPQCTAWPVTAGSAKPEAYRYLHEALDVIAQRALNLEHILTDEEAAGELILCLDGTLIYTDAVSTRKVIHTTGKDDATGQDVIDDDDPGYKTIGWFSGKHWCFGGNLQVLSNRDGRPLYITPVEPGATHDITAAQEAYF